MTSIDVYGGIADVQVPEGTFEFGEGVTLAPAQAHLMRPFLMTFRRPDSSFPGMMSAEGSFGFDVVAEFFLPEAFQPSQWFDRIGSVWWLAALVRLRGTPHLRVPVLSNASFSALSLSSKQSFLPIHHEAERTRLVLDPSATDAVTTSHLFWVRDYWLSAGRLMHRSREFNVLFQAFDQSSFARDPLLALLLMWSGLESLFSPGRSELRFRVSANIAAFLEAPGESRASLQRHSAKLYDSRSAAVHGRPELADKPLLETYALLKRVLIRIIENNHVPTVSELESALFCGR
jgi:hypothetical protein